MVPERLSPGVPQRLKSCQKASQASISDASFAKSAKRLVWEVLRTRDGVTLYLQRTRTHPNRVFHFIILQKLTGWIYMQIKYHSSICDACSHQQTTVTVTPSVIVVVFGLDLQDPPPRYRGGGPHEIFENYNPGPTPAHTSDPRTNPSQVNGGQWEKHRSHPTEQSGAESQQSPSAGRT